MSSRPVSTSFTRRTFLRSAAASASAAAFGRFSLHAGETVSRPELPEAHWDKLPRWRGFNLLNYFMRQSQSPFEERTFRDIADCGFNFVRIPMDYRSWILDDDWNKIDAKKLDDIFQAVQFGDKYNIHVQFNFHRAPGYTVASPKEAKSLWTDPEAREVCARHWVEFARRARGVPSRKVSFNLFNEPDTAPVEMILPATIHIIEAIRAEDPQRLIVCDGRRWGREPIPELIPYRVAQATRGYDPFELSHYGATWVQSENFPLPSWPMSSASGLLPAPNKKMSSENFHEPITLDGPFAGETALRLRVGTVSGRATLSVEADGKELLHRLFLPGEGKGEWQKAVYTEQWKIWQNVYNLDVMIPIPAGTKRVVIKNLDGDWLSLSEMGVTPSGGREAVLPFRVVWDKCDRGQIRYDEARGAFDAPTRFDRAELWRTNIKPWQALEKAGPGVMVGEFGAYNKTPHDVVLRWMEDMLANWKQAGWGWALWNWSGSIGVLESGRADVDYELWRGQKVDRKMMNLLQKY